MTTYYADAPMPWGRLRYLHDGTTIQEVVLSPRTIRGAPAADDARLRPQPLLEERLKGYRDTGTADFSEIPLDPGNATDFQKAVWQATHAIPAGMTKSYEDIACAIGRPKAMRAVGGALGANPLPLLVPCHRVIAKDGGVGGFSAGTELKKRILTHERRP